MTNVFNTVNSSINTLKPYFNDKIATSKSVLLQLKEQNPSIVRKWKNNWLSNTESSLRQHLEVNEK